MKKKKKQTAPRPAPRPAPPPASVPSSPWQPASAQADFATQLKADPSKYSLLLNLPPEIRNLVYEYTYASTGGVRLPCKASRRYLATRSALCRANKQVHNEFLTAAWLLADVHTVALDFDFRHIVTFLNRLSEGELDALPNITLPSSRRMVIELIPGVGQYYHTSDRNKLLYRWIRRAAHPTKKGTNVLFEYVLDPAHIGSDPVQSVVQTCEWRASYMADGKNKRELQRIVAACRMGRA